LLLLPLAVVLALSLLRGDADGGGSGGGEVVVEADDEEDGLETAAEEEEEVFVPLPLVVVVEASSGVDDGCDVAVAVSAPDADDDVRSDKENFSGKGAKIDNVPVPVLSCSPPSLNIKLPQQKSIIKRKGRKEIETPTKICNGEKWSFLGTKQYSRKIKGDASYNNLLSTRKKGFRALLFKFSSAYFFYH
jgi:hypothetical protein